jgi:hypothetical protein
VDSVIEFGCGDGAQLRLARYPSYIGLDVSCSVLARCIGSFSDDPTKSFFLYSDACFQDQHQLFCADLACSLDVIYHLVEDETFDRYMRHLFGAADRFVVVYSSNSEISDPAPHVKHRRFSNWTEKHAHGWKMIRQIKNPYSPLTGGYESSAADFYIFATKAGEVDV